MQTDEFVTAFVGCEMEVQVETDKAIGISEVDSPVVEKWIPKNLIDGDIPRLGDKFTLLEIPKWLADREGFEYEG